MAVVMSACAPGPVPRPTRVRGNDWRQVALPAADRFAPVLGVSVVVPYYEAPRELELVLSGLGRQTYPRELFEVIVVDDGSEPPLERPAAAVDVALLRQERCGFGLARARNAGAAAARHGLLVFLDGDVVPAPGLLAAHARWHHAVCDAVTLGFRSHVLLDGLDAATVERGDLDRVLRPRRTPEPAWRRRFLADTDDLTVPADDLFKAMVGCNFGVSRAFYEAVGGCDASFCRWGMEDTEFAYRAYQHGALLVPTRDALGWHLGPFEADHGCKVRNYRAQRHKVEHLIAHPDFRTAARGRTFRVPGTVVTVRAGSAAAVAVADTVEALLGGADTDLVVRIELAGKVRDGDRTQLDERFDPDPRVRVAPPRPALDEFAATPFHVTLESGPVPRRLLPRLRAGLAGAAAGEARLADGRTVSVARAWALHRAARAGLGVADIGAVVAFRAEGRCGAGLRRVLAGTRAARCEMRRMALAARARARRVGNLRSAGRFVRWTAVAVGRRLLARAWPRRSAWDRDGVRD